MSSIRSLSKASTAKLLLLGDSSVGKSSLILRFCENDFNPNTMATIGIDYKVKNVNIDGVELKLQLWDTAGQEKFKAISYNYYKNSMGIIMVFDMTDVNTFQNVRNWMSEIFSHSDDNTCKILIANKSDLLRKVSTEEIENLADELKVSFFECSAKTGMNVENAFMTIARNIRDRYFPEVHPSINLGSSKNVGSKPGKILLKKNTSQDSGIDTSGKCKC